MSYSRFLFTTVSSCLLLAHSAFATTSATAASIDPNAPVTRAQFPALLRETLLNDPTILMEVVEKMQSAQEDELAKKAKEGIEKHRGDLFSDQATPTVGPADADVTMVEFFDYHCGYCKQALASISKLIDSDKKLKVAFKEFPILSEDSKYAAKAAIAVYRIAKDKYFDFHKAMFAVSGAINEDVVVREATKLGIDVEKLKTEIKNPEIDKHLSKNKELGNDLGIRGTPAILIGDTLYPGAIPYETMQKAIADLRDSSKKDDDKDAKKDKPKKK